MSANLRAMRTEIRPVIVVLLVRHRVSNLLTVVEGKYMLRVLQIGGRGALADINDPVQRRESLGL